MVARSGLRAALATPMFAALLWVAGSCARSGESLAAEPAPAQPDSVFLDVVNANFYDARVYAVYAGGHRHPLGDVPSNQRVEGLAFPWQPRELVFEVDLVVGFASYVSHTIDVERGEYLVLRLPPNFSTSGSFTRVAR